LCSDWYHLCILSSCITQRNVRRQGTLVSHLFPLGPQQAHHFHVATDLNCGGSMWNLTLQFLHFTEQLNTTMNMRLVRANDKNHTKVTIIMLGIYRDLLSGIKYGDNHAVKIIILRTF
jgi:hypothetical protein